MFAEKHYPEILLPEELDDYLSRGWYRMGQTIFTTHFLCFTNQFYSAIWVRLNLKDYQFKKRLRKIMRKNSNQFRVSIQKAFLNAEKEHLYQHYKATFPGILAPTLKDSLLDGEDYNIFNTYEITVYDDDCLVALSFFDLGQKSVASIMGIYHPDYSSYSLGFYTMLMEITFSLNHDFDYYYPGYVVPGYPRFDYKLRIGDVDYFDLRDSKWHPFLSLNMKDIPLNKMTLKLQEQSNWLAHFNILHKSYLYPLFEANLFGFWRAPYFDFPIFLICYPQREATYFLMIVYNISIEKYQLIRCVPFDDLQFYFNESFTESFDKSRFFMELIVIDQILASHSSPEVMAQALRNQFSLPSTGR